PLCESPGTRYLERAVDEVGQLVSRLGENRTVILAVDGDERDVRVLPVGNRDALRGSFAPGIDGEVENDLSRVQRTRGPSHRAVRARLVGELTQPAVALVAAENEGVGSTSSRTVESLLAE